MYVPDFDDNTVKTCSGGSTTTLATGLSNPFDVSVTAAGDVYVLQSVSLGTPAVKKLPGGNASAMEDVPGTSNIASAQSFYIDGTVESGEA